MKSTIPDTGIPITPPAGNGDRQENRHEASLHGEILLRLRDYVVEGNIPEGARVPERQLCEMLGISRTPLREALKVLAAEGLDRKSTRLNSSHTVISYAVFCLKKKKTTDE